MTSTVRGCQYSVALLLKENKLLNGTADNVWHLECGDRENYVMDLEMDQNVSLIS